MADHHAQAVELSRIVLGRTGDPTIRTLATDILLTSRPQIGMMQGWLDVWGLPLAGWGPRMAWMGHAMGGPMPGMATAEEIASPRELPPAVPGADDPPSCGRRRDGSGRGRSGRAARRPPARPGEPNQPTGRGHGDGGAPGRTRAARLGGNDGLVRDRATWTTPRNDVSHRETGSLMARHPIQFGPRLRRGCAAVGTEDLQTALAPVPGGARELHARCMLCLSVIAPVPTARCTVGASEHQRDVNDQARTPSKGRSADATMVARPCAPGPPLRWALAPASASSPEQRLGYRQRRARRTGEWPRAWGECVLKATLPASNRSCFDVEVMLPGVGDAILLAPRAAGLVDRPQGASALTSGVLQASGRSRCTPRGLGRTATAERLKLDGRIDRCAD